MSTFHLEAAMGSKFLFKRGDLIGITEKGHVYGYIIAQVVRHGRFFYCKSIETDEFHLVVFDPARHFMLCPDFNPEIRPDIDVISMGAEFYEALDKLFGYAEEDSSDGWSE